MERPQFTTKRLLLRPFALSDAPEFQRLAGAPEVASTFSLPHPFPDGEAERWIGRHAAWFEEGRFLNYAIVLKETDQLLGSIDLVINARDQQAELGYWLGVPYWNHGFCTEAGAAMLGYAFDVLALNKVTARHMPRNPASGRVMEKLGMTREGLLRRDKLHAGIFEDSVVYGILSSEWPAAREKLLQT